MKLLSKNVSRTASVLGAVSCLIIFTANQSYGVNIKSGKIYARTQGDGSFTDLLNIPPGFFGANTGGFSAKINLKSLPVYNFEDTKISGTKISTFVDTVINIEQDLTNTGSIPIHLDLLSLVTPNPITVSGVEPIDIRVSLSSIKSSSGHINIKTNSDQGGLFDTFLDVFPKFTFLGHNTNTIFGAIDTGALVDAKPVEIRGKDSVWSPNPINQKTIIGNNTTNFIVLQFNDDPVLAGRAGSSHGRLTTTPTDTLITVPEPLTTLGSVLGIGFGVFFRKKYSRQLKKRYVS